jgi:hypothetical protein
VIAEKFNELLQILDERMLEYEKFQAHVANIVSVDIQKINLDSQNVNLKIQSAVKRLTIIAIGLAITAIVVEIAVGYFFRPSS